MSEENRIISLLELKDIDITQIESSSKVNLIFISVRRGKQKCPLSGNESDTNHDYLIQVGLSTQRRAPRHRPRSP